MSVKEANNAVKQEWPNTARDVNLREAQVSAVSYPLRFVGWLALETILRITLRP
jgi:hypothetical protein